MQYGKVLFLALGVFVLLGAVFAASNDSLKDDFGANKEKAKLKLEKGKKNLTEKIDALKFKYKEKIEKYKEFKDKWSKNKKKWLGLGLMLESQEGRAATIEYLQVLGAKVQDHFEKLQDKNGPFVEYLKTKTDEVNEVLANLDINSTKEDIVNAIKDVKKIWSDSEHKRRLAIAEKYVLGTKKVITKMESALNKLGSKITSVEKAGIDANDVRVQYYKAQENVANLKLEINLTQEKLKTMLNDEKVVVKEVNDIIHNLNKSIQETRQSIVKTMVEFNKLKNQFMKEIKEDKKEIDQNNDVNEDADNEGSEDANEGD